MPVRRFVITSLLVVALTGAVGATPASAATCTAAVAADLPPLGTGGGDFSFLISTTVSPVVVGAYLSSIEAALAALRTSLPAGSSMAVVNVCV